MTRTRTARPRTLRPQLQTLEDRTVPSFGFGSAFGFGGTGYDVGMSITIQFGESNFTTTRGMELSASYPCIDSYRRLPPY